jgi:hypothetical protein
VLFRPDEHEPLTDATWDEARAGAAIAAVVADAEAAVGDGVWPIHPQDRDHEERFTTLYLGSAGMAWALHTLGSEKLDLGATVARALELYRERPDFEPDFGDEPSLWMGESGLLLVAALVGSSAADDARLLARVRENVANESWELMWGSAGTMLAARERGFDEAWRESADRLWAEWDDETDFWTQNVYGRVRQHLGPAHGLVGNVHALRGLRDGELAARLSRVLERTVLREDGLANWPPTTTAGADEIRVQWCHGAPGIVTTVGDLMPDELALAGGELTWLAGPLAKGPGLCHGTAGNGYAFLKLFALSGDERWLERARRFGMHALEQVERVRADHGHGRYTLWTGDVGVALYLRSCIDADPRVPTIDFW